MQTTRRKLLDEISVPEMRQYREQGYTNKQIAELLDISASYVSMLLGRKDGKPTQHRPGRPRGGAQTVVTTAAIADVSTKADSLSKVSEADYEAMKAHKEAMQKRNETCSISFAAPVVLNTVNIVATLEGKVARYATNQQERTVRIIMGDGEVQVKYGDIATLCAELAALAKEVGA